MFDSAGMHSIQDADCGESKNEEEAEEKESERESVCDRTGYAHVTSDQ